jgi:hypothetical protein
VKPTVNTPMSTASPRRVLSCVEPYLRIGIART